MEFSDLDRWNQISLIDPAFLAKVDIDIPSSCWIWIGAKVKSAATTYYGKLKRKQVMWLAHRYIYTLVIKIPGPGLDVGHNCHTSLCVNPNHLTECTRTDNLYHHYNRLALEAAYRKVQLS